MSDISPADNSAPIADSTVAENFINSPTPPHLQLPVFARTTVDVNNLENPETSSPLRVSVNQDPTTPFNRRISFIQSPLRRNIVPRSVDNLTRRKAITQYLKNNTKEIIVTINQWVVKVIVIFGSILSVALYCSINIANIKRNKDQTTLSLNCVSLVYNIYSAYKELTNNFAIHRYENSFYSRRSIINGWNKDLENIVNEISTHLTNEQYKGIMVEIGEKSFDFSYTYEGITYIEKCLRKNGIQLPTKYAIRTFINLTFLFAMVIGYIRNTKPFSQEEQSDEINNVVCFTAGILIDIAIALVFDIHRNIRIKEMADLNTAIFSVNAALKLISAIIPSLPVDTTARIKDRVQNFYNMFSENGGKKEKSIIICDFIENSTNVPAALTPEVTETPPADLSGVNQDTLPNVPPILFNQTTQRSNRSPSIELDSPSQEKPNEPFDSVEEHHIRPLVNIQQSHQLSLDNT